MTEKTIQIRLFGGLGNQFFQYYAGIHFSQLLGSQLNLDVRWIEGGFGHSASDLRDFKTDSNVRWVTTDSDGSVNFSRERVRTILARKLPTLANRMELFVPNELGYCSLDMNSDFREVRGYFQSADYYSKISPTPRALELKDESKQFIDCRDYLLEQTFLGIHIRGGDYLAKHKIYRNLSRDYYVEAIDSALTSGAINRMIVFSDDVEYARHLLGSRYRFEFLPQTNLRASEELVLMSLGSSFVIANSTFSYWAAFRSGSKNVFAPESWLHKRDLLPTFYPLDWTRVPVF